MGGPPMHELAIAQEVVQLVCEHVAGTRVKRVVLEIGRLSAVSADAMRGCFELCAEGTPLEGAELQIVDVPGLAQCRACAAEVVLERPFGMCRCGSSDLEWRSGEELTVREVELV
jgi:hydrogenase nickel incorporation protein HypA/HybF